MSGIGAQTSVSFINEAVLPGKEVPRNFEKVFDMKLVNSFERNSASGPLMNSANFSRFKPEFWKLHLQDKSSNARFCYWHFHLEMNG